MAKEQFAVAELIANIILGKTDNPSRVRFHSTEAKISF